MKKQLITLLLALNYFVILAQDVTKVPYADSTHTYKGKYLTGIDFPVGALGGSVIRMNGKAERQWWQIFNNFEERAGSGVVPNSFFAIRAKTKGKPVVRVLQTTAVGDFDAVDELTMQGEYPFGWYEFVDNKLPVEVSMEAYNPLIPMDMKNSAIPCGIFNIKVSNPTDQTIEVSILGTQQNAVGFTGYDTIAGPYNRKCRGYGNNTNTILSGNDITSLKMTGNNGSMQLSVYESDASATASWENMTALLKDFIDDGKLVGEKKSSSPTNGVTVDGALATDFSLKPGEEKTITFVLSWHFPKGTFGRCDIAEWCFLKGGSMYENWWADANEVDQYVRKNFNYLETTTNLYHETMYSSNIPRYALDRITSNLCVLKSPTVFWTKHDYFGIWESTSSNELWMGNCKHVGHYAQGHARAFPELGRTLRKQDLNTITREGLLPDRDGGSQDAMDGHFGSILGIYREHLLSDNDEFLYVSWPLTKKAINYAISRFDNDKDGMMKGDHHNTLDCNASGTSPWIGTMYMAALKACEQMATIVGDNEAASIYRSIWTVGIRNQNEQLWDDKLGHYKEKSEFLEGKKVMTNATSIDMLLGQWWANQLNLGQLYPADRTIESLTKIYQNNKFTDTGTGYKATFRDFLGTGDTGWFMNTFPGDPPENSIYYYHEVMSGFEYAAASTMLQYGMISEGLHMIGSIASRYDGRFRGKGEVHLAENSCVFGTGSPFGEDECGDFYTRPMSSWSALLAMQGFIYDGPKQKIGFKPTWQPEDHASFFTTSKAWGLFTQRQTANEQTARLAIKFGSVDLREIILAALEGKTADNVSVVLDGEELAISSTNEADGSLVIKFKNLCKVTEGSDLTVVSSLK